MKLSLRPVPLCIAAFIAVSANPGASLAQGLPPEMPVSRADLMVRKAGGVLIDVRTPAEWRQTGVPVTAHTISLEDADFVTQVNKVTGGDKSQRVVLISNMASRSAEARDVLIAAGYQNVTSVAGGVNGPDGWIDADLPVRPYN